MRFIRQKNRVFGALGQPLLFWVLLGSSFGASFHPQSAMSYSEYFFPGVLTMVLLFTAIFSSFSIIEDRKEGFLQAVLVSPAPRLSIILGKVFGGATIATLQATLFLLLAPFIGIHLSVLTFCLLIALLFVVALGLTALGFCLAWRMDSVQGFHAIMMLILMPLWFLSGAFFPSTGLPLVLKILMSVNPLTYGLAVIRHLFYWGNSQMLLDIPSLQLSLSVSILFGLTTVFVGWILVRNSKHFKN